MKVFISWSGDRSKVLAHALRDWIPLVLHYVEPWLSEADVTAGDRWAQEVAKELEATNFGIICVTPENVNSQWILFEAGALAKSMQGSKVVPLLFNLEFSDISGPLAQFQAKKVSHSGLKEVIESVNQTAASSVPVDRAKQLFGALWPEFEKKLEAIPEQAPTEKHMRPQHEIVEELVAGVRGLDARVSEMITSISEPIRDPRRHRMRRFHRGMLEEAMHMLGVDRDYDDPIALLLLASFVRDEAPFLHEVLVEAYREMKKLDASSRLTAAHELRRTFRMIHRGPIAEVLAADSKQTHMLIREMSVLLDRYLDRSQARHEEQLEQRRKPEGE